MEKYRFSVISSGKNSDFDVRCLHCMYLFSGVGEKYMNKVVSRIVLPTTQKVSEMVKVELTPAPLLPGMKGGPYTPTLETLPCSTKDKIVNLLLSEHENKLGHFADCWKKKCVKFTDTWKMYNVFYDGKLLTRVYRKPVYSGQFISDELRKIVESYNKYFSSDMSLDKVVIKTESGQDITEILFPNKNLFLNSDLDFLDDYFQS